MIPLHRLHAAMPCLPDFRSAPRNTTLLMTGLATLGVVASLMATGPGEHAAAVVPRVVEVPSRPAYVRPPAGQESAARAGQRLDAGSRLRTQKPGRLQVLLANGRSFRLGGDAVARPVSDGVAMEKGQIIAWVNPGTQGGSPLRVRTRVGTASIMGTTVFLDVTAASVKVFSWEGHVSVTTDSGQRFELHSGQQVAFENGTWSPPRRLTIAEASARRQKSILLNGFTAPMETLPVIERELGLPPQPGAAGPATP